MARKATVYKAACGSGEAQFDAKLGTCEAGGTLAKPHIGVIRINKNKWDALTANEKTALGALTVQNLIDAARGYSEV